MWGLGPRVSARDLSLWEQRFACFVFNDLDYMCATVSVLSANDLLNLLKRTSLDEI